MSCDAVDEKVHRPEVNVHTATHAWMELILASLLWQQQQQEQQEDTFGACMCQICGLFLA